MYIDVWGNYFSTTIVILVVKEIVTSQCMPFPKAILSDWDETLAHTRDAVVEALEYVLMQYNKEPWEITKTKYRDTSKSLKENFPNFFAEDADEACQ